MLQPAEAFQLQVGQAFSFGEADAPECVVTEVKIVDDEEFQYLFAYDTTGEHHLHPADHTRVYRET